MGVTCSGLIVGGATEMILPTVGNCPALENFTWVAGAAVVDVTCSDGVIVGGAMKIMLLATVEDCPPLENFTWVECPAVVGVICGFLALSNECPVVMLIRVIPTVSPGTVGSCRSIGPDRLVVGVLKYVGMAVWNSCSVVDRTGFLDVGENSLRVWDMASNAMVVVEGGSAAEENSLPLMVFICPKCGWRGLTSAPCCHNHSRWGISWEARRGVVQFCKLWLTIPISSHCSVVGL